MYDFWSLMYDLLGPPLAPRFQCLGNCRGDSCAARGGPCPSQRCGIDVVSSAARTLAYIKDQTSYRPKTPDVTYSTVNHVWARPGMTHTIAKHAPSGHGDNVCRVAQVRQPQPLPQPQPLLVLLSVPLSPCPCHLELLPLSACPRPCHCS